MGDPTQEGVRGPQIKELIARQAAFGRDAAALARRAGQIGLAIAPCQETGLIGFDDSVQRHWPVAETFATFGCFPAISLTYQEHSQLQHRTQTEPN